MDRRQKQSYKFKEIAKNLIFWIFPNQLERHTPSELGW